jgi:hypothetical protein
MPNARIQKLRKDMLITDDDSSNDYTVFPVTVSDAVVVREEGKEDQTLSNYLKNLSFGGDLQEQIDAINAQLNPIQYTLTVTPAYHAYTGNDKTFTINTSVKKKDGTPLSGYDVALTYQFNNGGWSSFNGNLVVKNRGTYTVRATFGKDGETQKVVTTSGNNKIMHTIKVGFTGAEDVAGLSIVDLTTRPNVDTGAFTPPVNVTVDSQVANYLWIVCDYLTTITKVKHGDFDVDLISMPTSEYPQEMRYWRSATKITPGTHVFNIS